MTTPTAPSTDTAPREGNRGAIAWFEIASPDADAAQHFYDRLFGWQFLPGTSAGLDYRDVITGDGHPVRGGLLQTAEGMPPHAVFVVAVEDVVATCTTAVELGGSVELGPITTETGLTVAYLADRDGNRFAVLTPPLPR